MKKIIQAVITILLVMVLMYSVVACDNGSSNPPPQDGSIPDESEVTVDNTATASSKTLIAYFSKTNTTESVAQKIRELTGADIFEIEREEPYPDAYTPTTEVALEEKNTNARPKLARYIPKAVMNQYEVIILGFPIWWHTAPMPVLSFLNYYDLSGKTIYTFCTAASSGISESTEDIRSNSVGATVIEGKRFGSDDASIESWVNSLNLPTGEPEKIVKALVTYFSMPETTNPDNMTTEEENSTVIINGEVLGNTQYMAYVIRETLQADIFRITPEVPYPTLHSTLVALAQQEKNQGARPKFIGEIDDFENYDVVFVGYPNWWGDMPMIMYTFFEMYDFSGKVIIPFNTHGGSGFSSTISTIRSLEPNATVMDGISISRNNIQDAEQQIITWVNSFGFVNSPA